MPIWTNNIQLRNKVQKTLDILFKITNVPNHTLHEILKIIYTKVNFQNSIETILLLILLFLYYNTPGNPP